MQVNLAAAPEAEGPVWLTPGDFENDPNSPPTRGRLCVVTDPNDPFFGQVRPPGPGLATFVYDGLGRLIQTYRQDRNDGGEVEAYYYDGVRRIRETTSQSRIREYVWGPGYVDEILCQYRYLPTAPEAGLNAAGLESCDAAVPANAELDGDTLPDLGDEPPPAASGPPPGGDGGTPPGGGGSQPAGWAGPVYYLQDANYNVVALVRPDVSSRAENVWLQYQYEPYGTTVAADVSASVPADLVNRIGHQGLFFERFCVWATDSVYDRALQPDDPATTHRSIGLYYNRNRWYSPELGRFVQRDMNAAGAPIVEGTARENVIGTLSPPCFGPSEHFAQDMNLYAYLGARPTLHTDPEGLFFGGLVEIVATTATNLSVRATVWGMQHSTALSVVGGILAAINMYAMLTDPEYLELVASTGGLGAIQADIELALRTRGSIRALLSSPRLLARASQTAMTWEEAEAWLLKTYGGQAQVRFTTPIRTRVVDQMSNGVIREAKSGYVAYSSRVLDQIREDAAIIRQGDASKCEWHFFRSPYTGKVGVDPRVLQELDKHGIGYTIHD